MTVVIAIPAGLNSTRVKRKMLLEFDGVPLIRSVYDSVSKLNIDTYVLTDSLEIGEVIPKQALRFTKRAENGTARLAQLDWNYDYVINIQGDMMGINEETLRPVLDSLEHGYDCITAYHKKAQPKGVKVIHQNGKALWFTRTKIGYGDAHLGIYAYKPKVLKDYLQLKDKYVKEDLEQNRLLGRYDIHVVKTKFKGYEINEQTDINRWAL